MMFFYTIFCNLFIIVILPMTLRRVYVVVLGAGVGHREAEPSEAS